MNVNSCATLKAAIAHLVAQIGRINGIGRHLRRAGYESGLFLEQLGVAGRRAERLRWRRQLKLGSCVVWLHGEAVPTIRIEPGRSSGEACPDYARSVRRLSTCSVHIFAVPAVSSIACCSRS